MDYSTEVLTGLCVNISRGVKGWYRWLFYDLTRMGNSGNCEAWESCLPRDKNTVFCSLWLMHVKIAEIFRRGDLSHSFLSDLVIEVSARSGLNPFKISCRIGRALAQIGSEKNQNLCMSFNKILMALI